MKVYSLKRKQFIKLPIEKVFDFFSKPENLEKITPSSLSFKIITPIPIDMSKGALIDYTIKLFFYPVHWRTIISDYNPPYSFIDQQIKGPYKFWHHSHKFKEVNDGVEIIDNVKYSVPFGVVGRLAHKIWIRNELNKIFDYRMKIINDLINK